MLLIACAHNEVTTLRPSFNRNNYRADALFIFFCVVCEFCESGPATKHCPDDVCGFMCDSCDAYRHESGGNKTIEYADHTRAKVPFFIIEMHDLSALDPTTLSSFLASKIIYLCEHPVHKR